MHVEEVGKFTLRGTFRRTMGQIHTLVGQNLQRSEDAFERVDVLGESKLCFDPI